MNNPNLTKRNNRLYNQLMTKLKRQRYNARRSARRVGYSEELIDYYLPTNVEEQLNIPDIKYMSSNTEARAWIRRLQNFKDTKVLGYKGTELNEINIQTKQLRKEYEQKQIELSETRDKFVKYYNQKIDEEKKKGEKEVEQKKLSYEPSIGEPQNLPYPGYKNVEKFKQQVERMKAGDSNFGVKEEQMRKNIIQSLENAMSKADDLTPEQKKDCQDVINLLNSLDVEDLAILKGFNESDYFINIYSSDQEAIIVSKDFKIMLERYIKGKEMGYYGQ